MTWVKDDTGHSHWVYEVGISHNEQDGLTTTTATTDDTQEILIAGKKFTAVKTVNLTKETTLCKRRVESQEEMSDHAIQNPMVFEFELELMNADSEYDFLDNLNSKKTIFEMTTHRGQCSNMIISKLSDRKASQQSNSTSATITVQQIMIGKTSTVAATTQNTDALPVSVTTAAESAYPGGNTLKYTVIGKWPSTIVPEQSDDESIVQHCDNLTDKINSLRSMNRMVPTDVY